MSEIMLQHAPKEWCVKPLGRLFRERKEKVSDRDFPPLSVSKRGILPQLESVAKADDGDNRKGVRAGDFVINSRSDRKGSSGLSNMDGSVSLINIVLQPRDIHPRFAHHLLRSSAFQEEFYRWGHGIVDDLWTTRYNEMKNIRLAIPDFTTQKIIVDFLDRETTRIDQLIEKKEKLISLLMEKRKSMISFAVTGHKEGIILTKTQKGNSSTRDLTFLEQFSSQYAWDSAPAKRRFRYKKQVNEGMHEKHRLALTLDGVIDRDIDDVEGLQSSDYSTYQIFQKDDLVFKLIDLENIRTSRVGHVPHKGIMSPAYIRLEKTSKHVLVRFYYWFFYAVYINNIFNGMGGGVRQNLTSTDLLELPVPLTDFVTQQSIANFLDIETKKLDKTIRKTKKSIELLKEFRASLITAAVTGQLDIHKHQK